MTEVEQYFGGILDGKIVACEKMKRISEVIIERYLAPDQFHFDYDIAKKHTDFIEKFCKQPSGDIGKPLKLQLFQKARLQTIFGFVDDNNIRQYNEALIIEGRKNGKALSLDTDIPTPNGFIKMRDIQVGDMVFGEDGFPHKVTFVSDVFKNHECYKVTFRGGASVICDAEHLWLVKNRHKVISTRKTCDILHYKHKRKDEKGIEYLYRVPVTKAVQYSDAELPVDPYTFGVWLGDGSSSDTRITASEEDIEETRKNIELFGHTTKIYNNKDRASSFGIDVVGVGKENRLLSALRELDVLNNKHIPDIYMFSSINQRLELIRGLMDTDGYCDKKGQCEFCQKDEDLVDQFREILSSLGIVSSKRIKEIKCNDKICHAFSVLFYTDKEFSCFRLERKHARLKNKLHSRMEWNSIVEIEKVDSVDCKCISVNSPNHLYLATKDYIVTHNTTETAAVEIDLLVNDHEGAPQIYNLATMLEQSKLGFNAAHKMILQNPVLKKWIRKRAADLYCDINLGFIKALASNSNSLDGLDVHGAVIDELSAIKDRDLYDLIKQAMGARRQPLLFCITTNGFVRDSIFDAQYAYAASVLDGTIKDDRFLPFVYELDDIEEWDKPECWIKANPALGTIKSQDYLEQMVAKAKSDPSFKPTVMVKDFNMKQNPVTAWLRYEELVNEGTFDMDKVSHSYAIGGCDLSATVDLTCATLLLRKPNDETVYVLQKYFIPQSKIDALEATKSKEAPYKLWAEQGWLVINEGAQVDYSKVTEWFVEMVEKYDIRPLWICYDRALSGYWVPEMEGYGFDMEKTAQGPFTWSQPMKEMGAAFSDHLVNYNNNPILRWCLGNTAQKALNKDGIETIQPVKIQQNRRIDGMVSLLNAWVGYVKHFDEYMPYVR